MVCRVRFIEFAEPVVVPVLSKSVHVQVSEDDNLKKGVEKPPDSPSLWLSLEPRVSVEVFESVTT